MPDLVVSATIAGPQLKILYTAIQSHQKIHLVSIRISIFSKLLHFVLKHMYDIIKSGNCYSGRIMRQN